MENMFDRIVAVFDGYGLRATTIVLATVAIVGLLKLPIVRAAEKREAATGIGKSSVTRFVLLLPPIVAFALNFVAELIARGGDVSSVDLAKVTSDAMVHAALAVALYESVKKQFEAYAARSAAKLLSPTTPPDPSETPSPEQTTTAETPSENPPTEQTTAEEQSASSTSSPEQTAVAEAPSEKAEESSSVVPEEKSDIFFSVNN